MKTFRVYSLLILIILLGFALRLYRLDAVPFRGDEAYTVQNWILQDISQTITSAVVVQDPQAPLSYISFNLWAKLLGHSEFALRSFPTLMNLLGIAALYILGRRLFNQQLAIFAAFLWAIHPFEIWHAQDLRNYALWASFSAISLYLALRALDSTKKVDWWRYICIALLTAYIYYLEIFLIAAVCLYVLIAHWRNWKLIKTFIAAQFVIALGLLPWYLYLWLRLQDGLSYGGTTSGFKIDGLITWFVPSLNFGSGIPFMKEVGIFLSILFFIAIALLARQSWRKSLLLSLIICVPMIGIAIISNRLNVFTPRYILGTVPAFLLLLLIFFQSNRYIGSVVYAFWVVAASISLYQSWIVLAPKAPAWDELATYLDNNTTEDEIIIQTGVDPAFAYYYRLAAIEAGEFALPANFDQPIPEIISTMEATAENYHSIWIVGQTFPDWQNAGVVEDWASVNLQTVRETELAGLPVRQFMNWDVLDSEIVSEPLASYANFANLVGVRTFTQEPTNELYLWLYWQALSQTEEALKVFVHLVGNTNPNPSSPLWSQDDQEPQEGRIQTSTWEINTVYRDVFVLPLEGVIAGDYSLLLGFYNPNTNERVLLPDGSDTFNLGSIRIEEGD